MRYSIMLQVVGFMTLVLVGTGAFFAWLQNRSAPSQTIELQTKENQSRF